MAKTYLVKRPDGFLEPMDEQDKERVDRWGAGEIIECETRKLRNGRHHRKGMALLRFVFENQDTYYVFERFLDAVKIMTGCCDTIIMPDGQVYYKVGSISFESMDEDAFTAWKNESVNVIFNHFIPAMDQADIDRVVANVIGFL